MKNELKQKIFERFPNFFPTTYEIEISDGWNKLIWKLCEIIEKEVNKPINGRIKDFFHVTQIKEKFGQLRFYTTGGNQIIFEAIVNAEKISTEICEQCGKKGRIDSRFGWLLTLCKGCYDKRTQEKEQKIKMMKKKFKERTKNKEAKEKNENRKKL